MDLAFEYGQFFHTMSLERFKTWLWKALTVSFLIFLAIFQAVAVNPEMRYSLARLKKDKSLLIVASERIETICGLKMGLSGPKNVERETWGDVEEIMSFPGELD